MSKEILCVIMLVVFFAVMIYVGFYSRKHATDVDGFVLGGRGVGPWLTAFASFAPTGCHSGAPARPHARTPARKVFEKMQA